MVQLRKDIWQPLVVQATIERIAGSSSLDGFPLRWLPPSRNLSYAADPFGYWHGGRLHVFFENFDYRSAHGTIGVHVLDGDFRAVRSGVVLQEPWHLSYPFVFDWDGAIWMLPEACASGTATLYRALDFPWSWVPETRIALDAVPIDATLLCHEGTWWMFYAPAGSDRERLTHLHLASAPRPTGPWTASAANPIRIDPDGARPGGSPFVVDGAVHLPVQDCRRSYGSGLRVLRIDGLGRGAPAIASGPLIEAPRAAAPFLDGCHTLSSAGGVTLIDVKRRTPSFKGLAMRPLRTMRRVSGPAMDPGRPVWTNA